jgi:hypothetical protein
MSNGNNPQDIGTITPASGNRLGGPLTGIDVPTLRDAWSTAPYLHDGSAATVGDAIRAHANVNFSDAELADISAYVQQIGNQEVSAPAGTGGGGPNTGTGLTGRYYNNTALSGGHVLQRNDRINFTWNGSPGPGVNADNFSVRWTGLVEASATGNFRFQTRSNDGVRLWINGNLVINNWTAHNTASNQTPVIPLVQDQRYAITIEYYDNTGTGVARLNWMVPGSTSYVTVPKTRLYAN